MRIVPNSKVVLAVDEVRLQDVLLDVVSTVYAVCDSSTGGAVYEEAGHSLFWTTCREAEAFAAELNKMAIGYHDPLSDEMPYQVGGPFYDDMLKDVARDLR